MIPWIRIATFSIMKTRFILLFLTALLSGCRNPFDTRKPEAPIVSKSSWIPPLSPDKVLVNLQNAVAERNTENFVRCLADPSYSNRLFYFEPNPETTTSYPGMFSNWGVEKEKTVAQQMFSLVPSDSVCQLTWTKILREIVSADTAVMFRQYRLEINHKPSVLPTVFEGLAEFRLSTDQRGEWMIYRWTDNSVSGSISWSELKAKLGG